MQDEPNDWCDFDPLYLSTHPKDGANIEIEYADGRRYSAIYSRAAGMYSISGEIPPPERTALKFRWRYKP